MSYDCVRISDIILEALIVGKYYRRVNTSCEHPTPIGKNLFRECIEK